ncbi:hypothetical protein ElyMa_005467400 [Elysia marginata]|uniref:Uncharacterized protein n=1 Tax=Elysia marginata TaxID=1093978 RepID=A0AAV4EQM7_9GAST|nr:hypothetical protein ElyMa_005467400 [Elysia marginata]
MIKEKTKQTITLSQQTCTCKWTSSRISKLTWAASSGTAAAAGTGRTGTRAVYSTWPTCCPPRAWADRDGRGAGADGGGEGGGASDVGGDAPGGRAVPAWAHPSSRPGQQLGGDAKGQAQPS